MKKNLTSDQSAGEQAPAAANISSSGEWHGSRKRKSRAARGGPRSSGQSFREKETFSADQVRDFAEKIRRMRFQELYFWLAFAALALLCTFATMAWGPQDGDSLVGMLVALAVLAALLYFVMIDHHCPRCQTPLTPSGRYARGTLDSEHCPHCQAPFNGPESLH